MSLLFPNRKVADFVDYEIGERVRVEALVSDETTPSRLVLHVNAVWREADPPGSRVTTEGRVQPALDLAGALVRWADICRNPGNHQGERLVLGARFMGVRAGPPAELLLEPVNGRRRPTSEASPIEAAPIHAPWKETAERTAWVGRLQPAEELICELLVAGADAKAPQVEVQWLARRAQPDQRLTFDVPDWKQRPGVQLLTLATNESQVAHLLWTLDGRRLITCGSFSSSVPVIWDAASGRRLRTLAVPPDFSSGISDLSCHPSGADLFAASCGGLLAWNLQDGAADARTLIPCARYRASEAKAKMTWSPEGTQLLIMQLVTSYDAPSKWNVVLWSTAGGRLLDSIPADSDKGHHLRWGGGRSPRLAVGSPLTGVVSFFVVGTKSIAPNMFIHSPGMPPASQPNTGSLRRQTKAVPQRPSRQLSDMAWSPDGALLALAGEAIEIWSVAKDPFLKRKLSNPNAQMYRRVAWSRDGTRVAAAWEEGAAVWSVDTGQSLFSVTASNREPIIAWSPAGEQLAVADSSGNVHIFRTASDKPAAAPPAPAAAAPAK